MTRGACVLLVLLSAACTDPVPPVRLGPSPGRMLTYSAERIDEWPDETYGYGGTLRTEVLYRTRCIDAVQGKRAAYDVRVLSVVIDTPERFGVAVDTTTPESEDGDKFGAEEIVRRLLERDGRLTLAVTGVPLDPPGPDQDLRDALLAWGAGYEGLASPAMLLLDEVLDGPRLVAQWNRAISLLLPPEPRPRDGTTWPVLAPAFPSPAGRLSADLLCTFSVLDENRCRIEATGPLRVGEVEETPPLGLVDGTMEAVLEIDRHAGTVTRYHETMTLSYSQRDGPDMPVKWTRILTLID